MLVGTTIAHSSRTKDTGAHLYARLHPNTEPAGNPEYGEYLEGDILVREGSEPQDESNPLNAITDPNLLWTNGIIYYTLDPTGYSSDEILLIEAGIADLVELTKVNGQFCIQIVPRGTEANYVNVENYSGCSSYVGMQGGRQRISLVNSCVAKHGTIMHEFLHAYGFHHEQKRYDRDDWVTINWDNIEPGKENNFIKLPPSEIDLLGTSYDYGSVLHYSAYAFAVDPSIPTIIPHDPNAEIGQRITLSALDIERVQILYGCLAAEDSKFFKNLDPKWIPKRNW
jgi:hypothetical protein